MSIFSSSAMQIFHHLLGCHAIGIIIHLSFFSALRFSNLLCQAKGLTISLQIDKKRCPD